MDTIIKFLKGRKSAIGTIAGALITFCLARGYLAGDTATLLSYILAALGIGVNAVEAYNAKKV